MPVLRWKQRPKVLDLGAPQKKPAPRWTPHRACPGEGTWRGRGRQDLLRVYRISTGIRAGSGIRAGRRMGDNLRAAARGTQQTRPVGGLSSEPALSPVVSPGTGNNQCCAPMALLVPGIVAVAGQSLPRCPCIPWGPGSTSLPFLAPSQSISAGQWSNWGRDSSQSPKFPCKGAPRMAWDVLTPCSASCFPRVGFSGFQGMMPVWARAQGEQVLHEIHRSPPCPSHNLPFPWLNPLTRSLTPHRSLDLLISWQICS